MIITCPSCSTRYKLDPAQFGPEGRRVRCTKCANVWTQMPADDLPKLVVPEPAGEPDTAAGGPDVDPPPLRGGGDAGLTPPPARLAARAAAQDRAQEAQEAQAGSRRSRAGWLLLLLVIVSLGVSLVLARETVVRAWPPAERLYTLLGIEGPRPGAGLAIKVTEHRQDLDGKTVVLIVKGEVTNTSDAVRDVPRLKATLRTDRGSVIADWSFATAQARLLPGETAPFVTRLENPAKEGTVLNIDFIANGR